MTTRSILPGVRVIPTSTPHISPSSEDCAAAILLPDEGEDFTAIDADNRYLVNPGSVGQPRDRNPQATCVIFDSNRQEIRCRRCDDQLEIAPRRILDAGLPQILACRLAAGI